MGKNKKKRIIKGRNFTINFTKSKMSSFSEDSLEKKLVDLNQSQQSIQGLSLWIIHHRKHHSKIVSTWQRELYKAKNDRKLVFLYLANDVVQNSRKKVPEFPKEFGHCLKKVLEHLTALNLDEKNSEINIKTCWYLER